MNLRYIFISAGLLLSGCGPVDIGTDSSLSDAPPLNDSADSQQELRYPTIGKAEKTEMVLYHINRPSVMQNFQDWNHHHLHPLDANNSQYSSTNHSLTPKRSPFLQ